MAISRIDRYIIGKFLTTYVFLIGIIIFMAIIFDYNEKIDKFTQSHVSASRIIFDYYLNFIPYFSNLLSLSRSFSSPPNWPAILKSSL